MNGTAFDTLAAARALREAGFEDRQAEAVAGVVRHAVGADRDTLATKADIAVLRADLETLRADIYRALWTQGAGLVAVMAALIAAFKLFGEGAAWPWRTSGSTGNGGSPARLERTMQEAAKRLDAPSPAARPASHMS